MLTEMLVCGTVTINLVVNSLKYAWNIWAAFVIPCIVTKYFDIIDKSSITE